MQQSWSFLLPRDIRNQISSYLDQYNKYYPVINYKKYLIKYVAKYFDTDKELKYLTNLQHLDSLSNKNFTDKGLGYLTNLQHLNCGSNKNFTDKDAIVNINMMRINTLEDEMLKLEMEEKLLTELQANILKSKSIDTYQLISLIAGTEYESSIREYTQALQKLVQ